MRNRSKLAIAAIGASLLMALAVGPASARNVSISHTRFRAVFAALDFRGPFGSIANCRVTLVGSFHRSTFTKVLETLVGHIYDARKEAVCRSGRATILTATLPWRITYGGFRGRLPLPTGYILRLLDAGFRVSDGFLQECLARTSAASPAIGIAEGITYGANNNGIVSNLVAEGGARIPCEGAEFINGSFEGSGAVTENEGGGAANVLVRLI